MDSVYGCNAGFYRSAVDLKDLKMAVVTYPQSLSLEDNPLWMNFERGYWIEFTRDLVQKLNVSCSTIHEHLWWIGKTCKVEIWVSHEGFFMWHYTRNLFLHCIVTGDENWILHANKEWENSDCLK